MDVSPARQEWERSMRVRGATVLAMFALAWAVTGSTGLAVSTAAMLSGLGVSLAATVAVVVFGARTDPVPSTARPRPMLADWYRRFALIGAVLVLAIGAAVALLVALGVPQAIPAAVCLLVGLHFLPLAAVFAQPSYWWTGALLCGVAAVGAVVFATLGGAPSRAVVGFTAALVLWTTAAHIARRG